MKIEEIRELQKAYGVSDLQEKIESGLVWKLEGSYGRSAMDALESGACFLPEVPRIDYYGSRVPARDELKPGTKGTLENSVKFWSDPDHYEWMYDEYQEFKD
jgi:hypothetical protein